MAEVDNIDVFETGDPHIEEVRAQLTGSTSTYTLQKIDRIRRLIITVEGTNSLTYTFSGSTITLTGTNDDRVNISVVGEK